MRRSEKLLGSKIGTYIILLQGVPQQKCVYKYGKCILCSLYSTYSLNGHIETQCFAFWAETEAGQEEDGSFLTQCVARPDFPPRSFLLITTKIQCIYTSDTSESSFEPVSVACIQIPNYRYVIVFVIITIPVKLTKVSIGQHCSVSVRETVSQPLNSLLHSKVE